jgi:hypothetical protein
LIFDRSNRFPRKPQTHGTLKGIDSFVIENESIPVRKGVKKREHWGRKAIMMPAFRGSLIIYFIFYPFINSY